MDMAIILSTTCVISLLLIQFALSPCCARITVTRIEWNATLPANIPTYCLYCRCDVTDHSFITDCSHKGLFMPPKRLLNITTELYMNDNHVKAIRKRYFTGYPILRILDLSENAITDIEIGAFSELISLEELYLHGQRSQMFIAQAIFKMGVFDGLDRLKTLTIHHNVGLKDIRVSEIPTAALMNLTGLENLALDGEENMVFDDRLLGMQNLTTIYMSGKAGTCEISSITSQTFHGVPNLRNLTMEKCRISKIGYGSFRPLTKIEYLDLSWNTDLEIARFGKVVGELKYTNLDILKINAIHNPLRAGTEILRGDMSGMQDLKITELHMNDNAIEYIDYGVFIKFPRTLKRLYMRRNKLNFGIMISEAVFNNDNLEVFDAADQLNIDRSMNQHEHRNGYWIYTRDKRDIAPAISVSNRKTGTINGQMKTHNLKKMFPHSRSVTVVNDLLGNTSESLPSPRRTKRELSHVKLNLKTLICTGSHSTMRLKWRLNFTGTTNAIEYIDFSRNFINIISEKAFDGLGKLKFLNLSGNFVERFPNNVFEGLDSLQVFDLSNNLFQAKLSQDYAGTIFEPMVQLTHLNLSSNRLLTLRRNAFRYLTKLEYLDLSENYIEALDVNLRGLNSLSVLKLANNRIQTIPRDMRSELDKFASRHTVNVDLSLNKLACNCKNIAFLDWLFTSAVHFVDMQSYYCSFNNGSLKTFNDTTRAFVDILKEECRSYTDIIIACSTGASFFIAVACCVSVYLNRWKLRYLYYMAKVKLDQGKDFGQDQFTYDVFLSYGDGDRHFVATEIVDVMEKEMHMRLNIRDRDFEIGELIAVNISKAIKLSKKTFLLVSRHFLANKWCNFEMNMARMEEIHKQRDVLVIIFLEPIPAHALPLDLVDLLRTCPNVELPEDINARFAFWQTCKDHVHG